MNKTFTESLCSVDIDKRRQGGVLKTFIAVNLLMIFFAGCATKKSQVSTLLCVSTKNLEQITKILTNIKDEQSAKDSVARLKELLEETEKIQKQFFPIIEVTKKLGASPNKEEIVELTKQIKPLTLAYGRLTKEKLRILQSKGYENIKNILESKEWLKGYMMYICQ